MLRLSNGVWNINSQKFVLTFGGSIGIEGITLIEALEGYGRDKNLHLAGFFELVDEPLEIIMLVDEEKCNKLFEAIKSDKISIFYSKSQAEFGFTA